MSEVNITFRNVIYSEPVFVNPVLAATIDHYHPSMCHLSFVPDRTAYYSAPLASGRYYEYRFCDTYCSMHPIDCPIVPRRRLLRVAERVGEAPPPRPKRSLDKPAPPAKKAAANNSVVRIDLTREEEAPEAPEPPGVRSATPSNRPDGYDTAPDN